MYATNDLYLTAYLVARGSRLESFSRENGKTTFRLRENDSLDGMIRDYYADCGLVSGLRLVNSVKNLKNILYSNLNDNGQRHTHNTGDSK